MTELDLYKFVRNYNLEYNYSSEEEILLFVPFSLLYNFTSLLDDSFFDDGSVSVDMLKEYIGINVVDVCEYYGINYERIFDKNKSYLSEE